jgi:hypothetical protein
MASSHTEPAFPRSSPYIPVGPSSTMERGWTYGRKRIDQSRRGNRGSLANVSVKIGAMDLPVDYAGAPSVFAGLDQVNVRLPRSLAGQAICVWYILSIGKSPVELG